MGLTLPAKRILAEFLVQLLNVRKLYNHDNYNLLECKND